jgi:GxxExxY protein
VEAAYQRAVSYELVEQGIPFDKERPVAIKYRGRLVYTHRLDLVVANEILVELKAVERLHPLHSAQVLSGLRAAGLKTALLINFNVPVLRDGIRRFVLTT